MSYSKCTKLQHMLCVTLLNNTHGITVTVAAGGIRFACVFWSMYYLTEQLALPAWKLERRSDSLVNSVILWCICFVCFVCTVAAATVGRSAVPCRGPSKSISHYEPCNWSKQGTECDVCCISFAQRGSCGLCFNTLGVTFKLCQQDSLASFKEVFLQEAYIDDSVYLKYQSYC